MRGVGVEGVFHNTMRHTGVTLMPAAGVVNPRVIHKVAEWTTRRTLQRYGHVRHAEAIRVKATGTAVKKAINQKPDEARSGTSTEKARAQTDGHRGNPRASDLRRAGCVQVPCYHQVSPSTSPSSRGLGRGPFKAKTRVRIPLGT